MGPTSGKANANAPWAMGSARGLWRTAPATNAHDACAIAHSLAGRIVTMQRLIAIDGRRSVKQRLRLRSQS